MLRELHRMDVRDQRRRDIAGMRKGMERWLGGQACSGQPMPEVQEEQRLTIDLRRPEATRQGPPELLPRSARVQPLSIEFLVLAVRSAHGYW